jgi:hypothetical protein
VIAGGQQASYQQVGYKKIFAYFFCFNESSHMSLTENGFFYPFAVFPIINRAEHASAKPQHGSLFAMRSFLSV